MGCNCIDISHRALHVGALPDESVYLGGVDFYLVLPVCDTGEEGRYNGGEQVGRDIEGLAEPSETMVEQTQIGDDEKD